MAARWGIAGDAAVWRETFSRRSAVPILALHLLLDVHDPTQEDLRPGRGTARCGSGQRSDCARSGRMGRQLCRVTRVSASVL